MHGASADSASRDAEPQAQTDAASPEPNPWYLRVGALDAFYDSSATIKVGGEIIPGATARVSDGGTVMVDVGYDLTRNISILLMGGLPPKPSVTGEGTVSSLGMLGKVHYGSAILTGTYHFRDWGRLQPYVGMGLAYAIILHSSVPDLGVHNSFGFATQAGVECSLDQTWGVFVDVKKVFLSVGASGHLSDAAPVVAGMKLNPILLSTGITFRLN